MQLFAISIFTMTLAAAAAAWGWQLWASARQRGSVCIHKPEPEPEPKPEPVPVPKPNHGRTAGMAPGRRRRALQWLIACCVVGEGTAVVATTQKPVAAAVLATLHDGQRRATSFGARENQPRSLSSVYACFIARFLGGRPLGHRLTPLAVDVKNLTCAGSCGPAQLLQYPRAPAVVFPVGTSAVVSDPYRVHNPAAE